MGGSFFNILLFVSIYGAFSKVLLNILFLTYFFCKLVNNISVAYYLMKMQLFLKLCMFLLILGHCIFLVFFLVILFGWGVSFVKQHKLNKKKYFGIKIKIHQLKCKHSKILTRNFNSSYKSLIIKNSQFQRRKKHELS